MLEKRTLVLAVALVAMMAAVKAMEPPSYAATQNPAPTGALSQEQIQAILSKIPSGPGLHAMGAECMFTKIRADAQAWSDLKSVLYISLEDSLAQFIMKRPYVLSCGHSQQPNFNVPNYALTSWLICNQCKPNALRAVFSKKNMALAAISAWFDEMETRTNARVLCSALSPGYSIEDEYARQDPAEPKDYYPLMVNAVVLPCGHSFSESDVERLDSCPVCGAHFVKFVPNSAIRFVVQQVSSSGLCGRPTGHEGARNACPFALPTAPPS